MSKKSLIFLIIVLIVIALGGIFFYKLYNPPSTPTDGTKDTNFISNFWPFNNGTTTKPTEEKPANISGYVAPNVGTSTLVLKKISSMPVAGFSVFMKERYKETPPVVVAPEITLPDNQNTTTDDKTKNSEKVKATPPTTEFVPALRYVDKATGNIYQTFVDKIEERKISSTTIPQVHEALFGNKSGSVIMRYLGDDGNTIETFVGSLPKEIFGGDTLGGTETKGSFLTEDITDLSVAADTLKIFYLFNTGDSAVGITADPLGGKRSQVFNSPLTEWLSQYPNNSLVTLTTKPSSGIPGYMYTVDPNKKDFKKVLGNINGLTTLTSPNGKLVLYSNDNLSLSIYNTETRDSTSVGLKTLPEKCVWGKGSDLIYCAVPRSIGQALYPDAWYRGEVSFIDDLWRIDSGSGNALMLFDLVSIKGGDQIDAIKLSLDEKENNLFFINKKDSYLWGISFR